MFRHHLRPSPFGFALGLVLVALWVAVWIGIFATVSLEARARGLGHRPGPGQVVAIVAPPAA
jgi:hypothetical protein